MKLSLADRNPVVVRGAITAAATAIVHVLVVLALVPARVEDPISTAVDAIGLVVLLLWARAGVTPNAKVIARVTTRGDVVPGAASGLPAGAGVGVRSTETGDPILSRVHVDPTLVDPDVVGPVLTRPVAGERPFD